MKTTINIMAKWIAASLAVMCFCQSAKAQQWVVSPEAPYSGIYMKHLTPVDGGTSVLCAGTTYDPEDYHNTDGFVMKIGRDSSYIVQTTHVPGMRLEYQCATQLVNGNYIVFGVCDDSLSDPNIDHYLRADVFDNSLNPVSSRQYRVNDTLFGYFDLRGSCDMKSILTDDGTVTLVTSQYRLVNVWNYGHLCFYEFDSNGDTLRTKAPTANQPQAIGVHRITREPHSGNLQVFIQAGYFGGNIGLSGYKTVSPDFEIVKSQCLYYLAGPDYNVRSVRSEGRWDEEDHIIVSAEMTLFNNDRTSFYYETLYKIDTLANILRELPLPPLDSCMSAPDDWNTAYANDSTVFVLYNCGSSLNTNETQVNVALVDNDLNLLGRKVLRPEVAGYRSGPPVVFDDGGCVFPLYNWDYNYGNQKGIKRTSFMKMAREDIEITWNVIPNDGPETPTGAYPNPVHGRLNIPVKSIEPCATRLRILTVKGTLCVDAVVESGGGLISVDVCNLDPGLYVYQVVTSGKVNASGKFVKE